MGSVCNAPFFSFHIMWTNKIFWNKNEIENILVAESTEKSLKASHFKMELSYHYTNIKLLPCLFSYLSKYRLSGLDEFFFGICCFAFDAISYRNKGLSFSSNLTVYCAASVFQRRYQIGQMSCWHMSQFGLLGLARLQPLLRLRRYNFSNKCYNCMIDILFSHVACKQCAPFLSAYLIIIAATSQIRATIAWYCRFMMVWESGCTLMLVL